MTYILVESTAGTPALLTFLTVNNRPSTFMSFTGRRIAMGADGLQRQLSNYTPPGCSLGRGLTIADGVKLGVHWGVD